VLGQDKVTITKLASENAQLRDQLKEAEEREEELMAENQEYEGAIEEMAAVNTQFETQLQELEMAKKTLEDRAKQSTESSQHSIALIAEQVAALAAGDAAATSVAETGTVADAQLSRTRAYINETRKEIAALEAANTEAAKSQQEVEQQLEETKRKLSAAQMAHSQLEKKHSEAAQAKEKLTQTVEQLERKNQERQEQVDTLMKQLERMQEEMKHTEHEASASAADREKANELASELERQRELQREQNQEELNALKKQIEEAKNNYEAVAVEKDELALLVEELKADLAQARQAAESKKGALEELVSRKAEVERVEKKTRVIEEAAKQQLQAFKAVREKARAGLLDSFRSTLMQMQLTGSGSGAMLPTDGSPADPKAERMAFLEEQVAKLRAEVKAYSLDNKRMKGDSSALEKKLEARNVLIKNLEQHIQQSQQEMNRRLEEVQKSST
jgi:chromosome segregation ATPase